MPRITKKDLDGKSPIKARSGTNGISEGITGIDRFLTMSPKEIENLRGQVEINEKNTSKTITITRIIKLTYF